MTRFLTAPILYALLALVLLASTAAGVQSYRLQAERAAHAGTRQSHAEVLRGLAEATAQVALAVREREREFAATASANDTRYHQEKADALAAKDRVIDDLRRGALQLRDWWQAGPVSCPGDAAVAADSGGDAGAGELRAAGAGDLVQVGADADAARRWYITELIATRAACGIAGGSLP